jgi:hypothetical protein
MNPYSNPYAPPQADPAHVLADDRPAGGDVPDEVVEPLRHTKPWVTFLAVLGFLGTGLMGLCGLFFLGVKSSLPNVSSGVSTGIGLLYIVLAAVYVFPSLYLLRYGSAIGRLVRDPRMERLVVALAQQRSFWRLVGIITAVLVGLYPVTIVVVVVLAVLRGTGR